jgi:hypothetical protein
MFRHALSRDGTVEHPAHAGTVEMAAATPKPMIRRVKISITTMTQ